MHESLFGRAAEGLWALRQVSARDLALQSEAGPGSGQSGHASGAVGRVGHSGRQTRTASVPGTLAGGADGLFLLAVRAMMRPWDVILG